MAISNDVDVSKVTNITRHFCDRAFDDGIDRWDERNVSDRCFSSQPLETWTVGYAKNGPKVNPLLCQLTYLQFKKQFSNTQLRY